MFLLKMEFLEKKADNDAIFASTSPYYTAVNDGSIRDHDRVCECH